MLTNIDEPDTNVLLTVVVAFRDSVATLPGTLQSLSRANSMISIEDIELLFIDNGSDDGSRNFIDAFCSKQANARCIDEPSPGVSAARNAGLATARGDYIASVDSDDEVSPNYFSELIRVLKQSPDLVLLSLTHYASSRDQSRHMQIADGHSVALEVLPGWWCWQFVFRRALSAGLSFRGQCYEDFGFFPRLIQRSTKIVVLHGDLYCYLDNPNSLTRRNATWRLSQLEEVARDLLTDQNLTDRHIVSRVKRDYLHGRMQLRAIAGLWPVLSLRDCVLLIMLSRGNRLRQVWHILRLSASILRRKILTVIRHA